MFRWVRAGHVQKTPDKAWPIATELLGFERSFCAEDVDRVLGSFDSGWLSGCSVDTCANWILNESNTFATTDVSAAAAPGPRAHTNCTSALIHAAYARVHGAARGGLHARCEAHLLPNLCSLLHAGAPRREVRTWRPVHAARLPGLRWLLLRGCCCVCGRWRGT